jgi:YVTN family beta-propeller protein
MNRLRRSTVASVASLALAIVVVAAAAATASARSAALPRGGKVIATISIPKGFGGFALGEDAVWAMSDAVSTLTRIDPQRNAVAASIKVASVKACPPYVCGEPAAGNGAVWVPRASDNTVSRIDLSSNSVTATIPVGPQPTAIAVTPGAVWVANSGGPSISRIDPATNQVVATIRVGPASACCSPMNMTAAGAAVWVTVPKLAAVVRVDPASNKAAATIRLSPRLSGQPCGFVVADRTGVWASGAHCFARSGAGVVTRIDPRTNKPTKTVTGFMAPIGLALGYGSLWVADIERKAIDRVNPRTGRIIARLPVGGIPIRLAIGFGAVWVRDDTGRVLRIKPQG